jgi:hypothetical protein
VYVYELELHIADLNLIIIYTHIHYAAKSEHVSVLVLMNNGNGRCKDKESWAAEIRNALYNWKWPSLTDDKVSHTYIQYVCMYVHYQINVSTGGESVKDFKAPQKDISHGIYWPIVF